VPSFEVGVARLLARQRPGEELRGLQRLLPLREDSPFTMQTLGEIASADEHQANRLRLASRHNGHSGPALITIRDALRESGHRSVYCVTVACALAGAVDREMRALEHAAWWGGAMRLAILGQVVAAVSRHHADSAFAAALLADLGDLIVRVHFPALAHDAAHRGLAPEDERAAWGYSQRDLALALARHWELPPHLVEAIAREDCACAEEPAGTPLYALVDQARALDARLRGLGDPTSGGEPRK